MEEDATLQQPEMQVHNSMQGADMMGDRLNRRPISGERGPRPKTTGAGSRFADKGAQK